MVHGGLFLYDEWPKESASIKLRLVSEKLHTLLQYKSSPHTLSLFFTTAARKANGLLIIDHKYNVLSARRKTASGNEL